MKVKELIEQLNLLALPNDEVIVASSDDMIRSVIGVQCGSDGAWLILEGDDEDDGTTKAGDDGGKHD